MQHLDAVLALALTMGAFATVVTIILEIVFRIYCIRAHNLKLMFEKHVLPRLQKSSPFKELAKTGILISEPLSEIIENPVKTTSANQSNDVGLRSKLPGWISWLVPHKNGHLYDRVTLEHFLRSLIDRSKLRDAIADGKADIEEIRSDLSEALMEAAIAFDKMSGAMTQKFKESARMWTVIIGIGLAFLVNIDGVRIFDAYLNNEELTAEIIEQQDALQAQNTVVSERFEEIRSLQERISTLQDKIDKAGVNALQTDRDQLKVAMEEMDALVAPENIQNIAAETTGTLIKLQEAGVPIGWQYYPWNSASESCETANSEAQNRDTEEETGNGSEGGGTDQPEASSDEAVSTGNETAPETDASSNGAPNTNANEANECETEETESIVSWFFKVLITGLLIGLGGPFWFDLAKRLSTVRNVMRGKATTESGSGDQDADGNAVSIADLDAKVRAIVAMLLPKKEDPATTEDTAKT